MLERKDQNCGNCDSCVLRDGEPRCWVDPPDAVLVGMKPGVLPTSPAVPVVISVQKPTFLWYRCSRWTERTAEHPDYDRVPDATHEGTVVRQ